MSEPSIADRTEYRFRCSHGHKIGQTVEERAIVNDCAEWKYAPIEQYIHCCECCQNVTISWRVCNV